MKLNPFVVAAVAAVALSSQLSWAQTTGVPAGSITATGTAVGGVTATMVVIGVAVVAAVAVAVASNNRNDSTTGTTGTN